MDSNMRIYGIIGVGGIFMFEYVYYQKSIFEYWYMRERLWARKAGRFSVSCPRAGCAGPTRGSAENTTRIMLARPASDRFLAADDLTRPVRF